MRIFQGKYLVVSLIIHSAVISSFLLFQKSSEKAETFMLVTEIIKIKEPDKLKDIKKTDNHKTKVVKKTSIVENSKVKVPDIKAVLKPKTSPVTFKPSNLEFKQKTVDVKQARVEEKPKKVMTPQIKNLMTIKQVKIKIYLKHSTKLVQSTTLIHHIQLLQEKKVLKENLF